MVHGAAMGRSDDTDATLARAFVVGRATAYREAQHAALEVAATMVDSAALVRLAARFGEVAAENERVCRAIEGDE